MIRKSTLVTLSVDIELKLLKSKIDIYFNTVLFFLPKLISYKLTIEKLSTSFMVLFLIFSTQSIFVFKKQTFLTFYEIILFYLTCLFLLIISYKRYANVDNQFDFHMYRNCLFSTAH